MLDLKYTLGLDGSQMEGVLHRNVGGVGKLGAALGALGVTAFAGGMIKRGLDFNKNMNDSEAAIAKVIAQFQGLNDEAAKGEASKAMAQLVELEPKAAGSLSTLVDGFLSTLASSQAAGLSVQQNIDLVGRFANAMANANIPTEQLGQEMRSIITANIGADSSLARILGITNEMITQAREAGNVYGFLTTKIGKLGEAGDTAAVAFSSLDSAIDKAAGKLTAPLFDRVLAGAKDFTVVVEDMSPQIERLGEGLGTLIDWGKELTIVFTDFGTALGMTVGVYADMLTNGTSYAEALENAENALTEAINDRARAQDEAAKKKPATPPPAAAPMAGTSGGGMSDIERGRRARDMQESRNSVLGELEILRQQARGHGAKARAIERQLQIERDKLQIIKETGASEEQALKLAKEKADLEDKIERRKNGGRSHIGGVRAKRYMTDREGGPLSRGGPLTEGGGIDGFRRMNPMQNFKRERSLIPGNRPGEPNTVLVPQFSGSLSGRAAQRVGNAVMPSASGSGDKGGKAADPAVDKLDKILGELTRIRTA